MIALDLDGTFLDDKGKVLDDDKKAVEWAIEQGIEVVIASGRPYGSLPEEVLKIAGIRYAITSNGAAIYHLPTRKRIKEYLLKEDVVLKMIDLMKDHEIVWEVFVNGIAYADARYVDDPMQYGASEKAVSYIQRTRNKVDDMEEFIKTHMSLLDSIDLVVNDSEAKNRLENLLDGIDGIYVTSSVKQLIEISDQEAGKHSGLEFLGKCLGIKDQEMAAIGNDKNDIDMMRYAGIGIAVANASEECLQAADWIVNSNNNNGIKEAIRKLLLK